MLLFKVLKRYIVSLFQSVGWKSFRKSRSGMIGLVVVLSLFFIALFAPFIANSDPYVYKNSKGIYFPIVKDYPELKGVNFKRAVQKGDFAIFPPIPYSYSEYDLSSIVMPPSAKHILGTDEQGRDVASRMIYGARVSMFIGFIAVFIYVSIGIVVEWWMLLFHEL